MSGRRLRRRANIKSALVYRVALAGIEEESLYNRKYMVWETSIKTTYGRWHRGHPFDSSVIM